MPGTEAGRSLAPGFGWARRVLPAPRRATRTDTGCCGPPCSSILSNTGISVSAQRNRSIGSAPWSRCAFPNSQLPPRLQNDAMSSESVMGGCSSAMFSTIKLGYRQGRAWNLTTYRHAATGCRTPGAAERSRAGTATSGCCRGSSGGKQKADDEKVKAATSPAKRYPPPAAMVGCAAARGPHYAGP